MKVSIIIPVYNEAKVIGSCLENLANQTVKCEIILVDDGSTDATASKIKDQRSKIKEFILLGQNHLGPGAARNLGAGKASGDILVFVDADMEFEGDFIAKLTAPIIAGKTVGTFSQDEYLLNSDNPLARCWNLNLGRKADRMEPRDFAAKGNPIYQFGKSLWQKTEGSRVTFEKDKSHVFRAILKNEFKKVDGFDTTIGYTDDWSLSQKLGVMATVAHGAKYYHRNPETYSEVWQQARWFGKNEFLTRNIVRRFYNLFRYNIIFSVINGAIGVMKFREQSYLLFKIVYDTAVFTSVCESFFIKDKFK